MGECQTFLDVAFESGEHIIKNFTFVLTEFTGIEYLFSAIPAEADRECQKFSRLPFHGDKRTLN